MPVTGIVRGEQRPGKVAVRSSGGMAILDETYHYLVEMASVYAERVDVINVDGLPIVNVTQAAHGYSICKLINAVRREDQRLLWDVTATFSSEVDERQSSQSVSEDPVEWVPIYETKFERLQEVLTKDRAGVAIANSAGQPFETGIIGARFIPIWEFFQFEPATVTDETIIDRNETLNSETFKGRPENTLLCTVLSSAIGFYYGARVRLTKYALRYNIRTWLHRRSDVGTVYLDGAVHKAYTDDDGNVILGGLDGSGGKVAPGTEPAILDFEMFSSLDFSSFLRI